MGKILKQVAAIDVAKEELVITLGRTMEDMSQQLHAYKVFTNDPKGFKDLIRWVDKLTDPTVTLRYVMEATGVYHESFAYFLDDQGYDVSIVLPNKISNYSRTLESKTITDKSILRSLCLLCAGT